MNINNGPDKPENKDINEEDNINDVESKKFINSDKESENKKCNISFIIGFIKRIIFIIICFKFAHIIKRYIQINFLGNKKYEITSKKILWKNNANINLTMINKEIKSYNNMSVTFSDKEELYQRTNPKVSLIITVYIQEQFINKIYSCIEKQSLKDIEIIFVDDFSSDNSSKIIEELMKIDKRIVYVKNDENKGVFYSRNRGVLNSKGEYVLCVDIDDYLLNDILVKSYETAKLYDLDILQFYVIAGDTVKNVFWKVLKYKSGIRRYEDVKEVFFRGTTRNTWDKFIKRETFINSINFMKKKYRNENYVVYNDDIAIFGLFKTAQSYGFLEEVGYFYNWAVPNSTTHKYLENKYVNEVFKSCFTIMEYFYEQTENNNEEKVACYNFFKIKVYNAYMENLIYLTEGYDYIIKILDIYIDSKFYTQHQKKYLKIFKQKVVDLIHSKKNYYY